MAEARHVANCGYVTASAARGAWPRAAMFMHSLERPGSAAFARCIQRLFSTTRARAQLWDSLDFNNCRGLPLPFEHPTMGCRGRLLYASPTEIER